MSDHDDGPLFDEIAALLASAQEHSLEDVERTLTTGYARAHAIEAEQLRLERRIAEVARLLAAEGGARHTATLNALAARKSAADTMLVRLRGALKPLRDHAAALRRPAV